MSEMVERVALAIERSYRMRPGTADSDINPIFEMAKISARAAIEAMREPTWQMIDVADQAALGHPCQDVHDRKQMVGKIIWPAMIDAALK